MRPEPIYSSNSMKISSMSIPYPISIGDIWFLNIPNHTKAKITKLSYWTFLPNPLRGVSSCIFICHFHAFWQNAWWCFCAELMLLGFISLLLTVFQSMISKVCISKSLTSHMLPCKKETSDTVVIHYRRFFMRRAWKTRRLLSEGDGSNICASQVCCYKLQVSSGIILKC